MATATWDIATLERHLPDGDTCPDGAVYTIHYTVSLEEDGETAGAYGSIGLGDPDPDNFTPYSELTKAEAISWVKSALGAEQVASIEAALADQINAKLHPASANGVPW